MDSAVCYSRRGEADRSGHQQQTLRMKNRKEEAENSTRTHCAVGNDGEQKESIDEEAREWKEGDETWR